MAEFKWYGDKAKQIAQMAAKKALQTCAADLQGKSSRQAPIDTGDLRANCSVSPLKQDGYKISLNVGYDLPYARRQHETAYFKHPKGGKWKYLEDPFNENKSKYDNYIKEQVKKALGSD